MTEELKQKAKEWQKENCCKDCVVYLKEECNGDVICGGARGYIAGATETTKELQEENERFAKHILELQADKDNLTDKVTELEAQIEKIKQDLDNAREYANRQEQWGVYSVLNDIYNDNFEVITSVSN